LIHKAQDEDKPTKAHEHHYTQTNK